MTTVAIRSPQWSPDTAGGDVVSRRNFGRAGIPDLPRDQPSSGPPRSFERPKTSTGFDTIEFAIGELAAGRPLVVVDDENRENEGDLVFAAELATPEIVGFTVRYTSGVICVALTDDECRRLGLPQMSSVNQDRKGTAFTVTVDAKEGIGSGISAADRARTMAALADPSTTSDGLTRPGHVMPLRARAGGALERAGHTEAAVDLAKLAGLRPAAALCEIINDDGSMARLPQLRAFARRHRLALISIADLVSFRRRTEVHVTRAASVRLPLPQGDFRTLAYVDSITGREILALVVGDIADGVDILVAIHQECLTGDVFGSLRCDCRAELHKALGAVSDAGRGVVVYYRGESPGSVGLLDTLRSYERSDNGITSSDTFAGARNPADDHFIISQALVDLGVVSMRLLSAVPDQLADELGERFTVFQVAGPPRKARDVLVPTARHGGSA